MAPSVFLPWVWQAHFSPLVSGRHTSTDLQSGGRCWSLSVVVGRPRRAQRGPGAVWRRTLSREEEQPPTQRSSTASLHPLRNARGLGSLRDLSSVCTRQDLKLRLLRPELGPGRLPTWESCQRCRSALRAMSVSSGAPGSTSQDRLQDFSMEAGQGRVWATAIIRGPKPASWLTASGQRERRRGEGRFDAGGTLRITAAQATALRRGVVQRLSAGGDRFRSSTRRC